MLKLRGFSLIELVVVLAILGIVMGVGLPYLGDAIQNARIRSIANQMNSAIALARTNAITANNTSTITLNSDSSWAISIGSVIKSGSFSNPTVAITPNATTIKFSSVGFSIDNNAAPNAISLDITSGSCAKDGGGIACLRVEVLAGGLVQICNPNISTGVDNVCSL